MNNLKRIRLINGWSQSDVAEMMECWQSNIVHYEKGAQDIPARRAQKLIKKAKEKYQVVITLDQIYRSPELAAPAQEV